MKKSKKIKCIKCGIYFKDRYDDEDSATDRKLCWNCRFIWKCVGIFLISLPSKLNRDVQISLDDVKITKI